MGLQKIIYFFTEQKAYLKISSPITSAVTTTVTEFAKTDDLQAALPPQVFEPTLLSLTYQATNSSINNGLKSSTNNILVTSRRGRKPDTDEVKKGKAAAKTNIIS